MNAGVIPIILLAATITPVAAQMPPPTSATPPPVAQADQDGRPYHLVVEGDNLMAIAATYNLTLQRLVALNQVQNNTIRVGQKLYLAQPEANASTPPGIANMNPYIDAYQSIALRRPFHIVAVDENLFGIAAKYGLDPDQLAALNGIRTGNVAPGLKLVLPLPNQLNPEPEMSQDAVISAREPRPRNLDILGSAATGRTVVRSAVIPVPRRGLVQNPEAGRPAPADQLLARPSIAPGDLAHAPLASLLGHLPLIDKGAHRHAWSQTQATIAAFWERTPVRTRGILTSSQWTSGPAGGCLVLHIAPSSKVAATVRVVVPGAYMPAEIDTTLFNRWASTRVPVEVVGHLSYLDGPGPISLIRSGALLSPWSIVAQHVRVHVPGGPWQTLTVSPSVAPPTQAVPAPAAAPADPQPESKPD